MFVQEDESVEGLILGAGCYFTVSRQIRNVLRDFFLSHMLGVALVVEEYEPPDPLDVGLFCTNGVVLFADYFADQVGKSHGVPLSALFPTRSAPVVDQHTECAWSLQHQIMEYERPGDTPHIVANDTSVFSSSDIRNLLRYQFGITL